MKESEKVSIAGEEGEGPIPCKGAEDRRNAGINNGKYGTRNLKAESVRSRRRVLEGV